MIPDSAENPTSNALPPSVPAADLVRAVASSGYPVQTVIAKSLTPDFAVVEEWGYVDRESNEHRALDIHAYRSLVKEGIQSHLHPDVVLLIECKRSDLPFVFFEAAVPTIPRDFPSAFGFRSADFSLVVAGKGSRDTPPAEFLRLSEFPFVGKGPTICNSLTKVDKPGKIELSGETPFRSIVMPLASARDHWAQMRSSGGQQQTYYPSLTLTVCVLDAPMVLAAGTPESPELQLAPWVRVVRQEAHRGHVSFRYRHYVVDFVHRAFFDTFLTQHVMPFAEAFAERLQTGHEIVLRGSGTVPDWEKWTWSDVR